MAWESIFRTGRFSVGFAQQATDLLTAETTLRWISCEMPQVTYEVTQSAVPRSSQSSGSRRGPLPGRVIPRLAIKGELPGRPSDYDYTTDGATFDGLARVLHLCNSNTASAPTGTGEPVAYQANGIDQAGSDGNTITLLTDGNAPAKTLLAARDDDDGLVNYGFVEAIAGGGSPYTATLFEDLGVAPDDNADRLPTQVLQPDGENETFGFTVRVHGEHDAQKRTFIGWVPEKITLMVEDDILKIMAEGPCYGGETRATTGGGLQPLGLSSVDTLSMDAIKDTSRVCFGSQSIDTTLDDGTVDPYGSYDVRNLTWEWTLPLHPVENPAAILGVGACTVGSPELRASFAIPDENQYKASGVPDGISAWSTQATLSLSAYYGNATGKILAITMPAGRPEVHPDSPQEIDGVWYWPITLVADHHSILGPWLVGVA